MASQSHFLTIFCLNYLLMMLTTFFFVFSEKPEKMTRDLILRGCPNKNILQYMQKIKIKLCSSPVCRPWWGGRLGGADNVSVWPWPPPGAATDYESSHSLNKVAVNRLRQLYWELDNTFCEITTKISQCVGKSQRHVNVNEPASLYMRGKNTPEYSTRVAWYWVKNVDCYDASNKCCSNSM